MLAVYPYTHAGLTRRSLGPSQVLELLEPSLAPFPNDQYIWVVDFHQFSIADANPSVAKGCLGLFGRSYPERLGGMIMVGAPMLFNGLFRAVSAFAVGPARCCSPRQRMPFI